MLLKTMPFCVVLLVLLALNFASANTPAESNAVSQPPSGHYTLRYKLFSGERTVVEGEVAFINTQQAQMLGCTVMPTRSGDEVLRMNSIKTLVVAHDAELSPGPGTGEAAASTAAALAQAKLVRFGPVDVHIYAPDAERYELELEYTDTSQMNWVPSADSPIGWLQVAPEQMPQPEQLGVLRGRLPQFSEVAPFEDDPAQPA